MGDFLALLHNLFSQGNRAPLGMNQPDLDPRDPNTQMLTPGGQVPVAEPVGTLAPPNGGTTRPLNAQEALQAGDPKLIEFMKKRQGLGAQPIPTTPVPGFGAVPR